MDCPEKLEVIINGKPWTLRDDGTTHLGTNAYYRLVGTNKWYETDTYGRTPLTVGKEYEVMWLPQGAWPSVPVTRWDKIWLFLSRWL